MAGQVFAEHDADLVAASEFDLQQGIWHLLARQVSLYTMGESSSLSEYDAHRLLLSTCFVLGIDPDDPDPADLCDFGATGMEDAYNEGLRIIEEAASQTELLWKEVCLSTPLLESIALKDTLESLKDFKARYEPRFFAHEIPADIDYPLCQPVDEAVLGVDYVTLYLESLLTENRFLNCLDVNRCRCLLHAVHPSYGELIVNLFEPVAVNAIGLALVGADVRALCVDDAQRGQIEAELAGLSRKQLGVRLADAAETVCASLKIKDAATYVYVKQTAQLLTPRVQSALQTRGLAGVFLGW